MKIEDSFSMHDLLIKYSQLGDIFDYLSIGVMVLTPDRKIISLNKSAEMITGYRESDLLGEYCHHIFLDPLCGEKCVYLEAIKSGDKSGSIDFEVTDQTNANSSITRIVSPIYGPDEVPQGCIEVFQDHSAFKDLLERVGHDDRRLKSILDHLDIGVLTVDRGGHVTLFNSTAESITGFTRADVLGKSCSKLFGKASSQDLLQFKETIADGRPRSSADGAIKSRQGQLIPMRANYMALKNESGSIVGGLATISDLSLKYQFNSEIRGRYTFYDMVGKDPAIQKIFEIVPVVASSDATILIEGPTGTGKDILAKVIHNVSPRAARPLVKVNCAALPDNLLESEMFGYVQGAFTGAEKDKPGRFQEADGGTLFLDEIGDLPLGLQAKLLRVLEDKEFYPLGKRMCATRDTRVDKIANDAMEVLLNYDYPGNIRELENIIEHALIVCRDKVIEHRHLPLALQGNTVTPLPATEKRTIEKDVEFIEKTLILDTLRKHNWNKGQTAAVLEINRTTLWRKMKKYGLNPAGRGQG
jgi:PAS domain S-box-containing protein